ncbi:MAG: hypothetical protein IJK28_10580 [Clostridia bacterium]|nr:hypothetical protein [Clostridia bacterium]
MQNSEIMQPGKDQPQRYSPQQTAAIRKAAVQDVLLAQTNLLEKADTRTNLKNVEDVQRVTAEYINMCADVGIVPNLEGLAARLGLSRSYIYRYIRESAETDPTAAFLNSQRLAWASARMALAERGMLDSPMSIFILRNSGLNFSNRDEPEVDVEEQDKKPPWLRGLREEEESKRLREYLQCLTDDEDADGETE